MYTSDNDDKLFRSQIDDAIALCEKRQKPYFFSFLTERQLAVARQYMDSIHFSPEINKLMLDQMISGEYEMTPDNYEQVLDGVKEFTDKIVNELMIPYEEADMLTYEIR